MSEQESQLPELERNSPWGIFFVNLEKLIKDNRTHQERSVGRMSTRILLKRFQSGVQRYSFEEITTKDSARKTFRLKVRKETVRYGEKNEVSLHDLGSENIVAGGYSIVIKTPKERVTDEVTQEVFFKQTYLGADPKAVVLYESSTEGGVTEAQLQLVNNLFSTISQTVLRGKIERLTQGQVAQEEN